MEEKTVTLTSDDVVNISLLIIDKIREIDSCVGRFGENKMPYSIKKKEILHEILKKLNK